ncbi:metal-dependent hydrolase [Methanocorpusculum vombati]|uniref:Metal-dependent hydrolase n=1 Tax=Methanocorpusculum vombati TaxID=3002864 RepID=A0ABT4IN24_9EURY|nr:metal-dependent hydrolase [Methanocorpusculum vombati]MCZ9319752.1 metal-dependent hydrolase [Methanocorpusculum sp.]MCZ0863137.1 metal-dependent hydrolase [Methanocorpusculum vombati]MDE2519855.1 metal-dependent hydrolase [Methanocorpusculum sp.]MDE2534049.1 metal-dependent hydrolase [Methanocorpusculum sp.]MDE2546011.1 metal-dependent hydrolase [Methanocorpusculum sp.]
MRGDDHIGISLGVAFLIISPILISQPVISVLFLIGVIIGSLLPDADASDSKMYYMSEIVLAFALLMKPIVYLTRSVYKLLHIHYDSRHRKSLHTILGITISVIMLSLLINIVVLLIGLWTPLLIPLCIGLYVGSIFHLIEDCCTKSGLSPLLPFSDRHFSGKIITSSRRNFCNGRPDLYAKIPLILGGGVLITGVLVEGLDMNMVFCVTVLLGILIWPVMYCVSR